MSSDETWGWDQFRPLACEILTELLEVPVDDLRPTDHLVDEVGCDSFSLLTFVVELEDRLGIELALSIEEPTVGNVFKLVVGALRHEATMITSVNGSPST